MNPAQSVLLFEAKSGRNRSGGLALTEGIDRHFGVVNVVFVDGHSKSVPIDQLGALAWKPEFSVTSKAK